VMDKLLCQVLANTRNFKQSPFVLAENSFYTAAVGY